MNMAFDIDAWLNEPLADNDNKPRHELLCYLVVANGGFQVRGWGVTVWGGVHKQGLDQDEALALMQYGSYMAGLQAAGVPIFERFNPFFDAYIQRCKDMEAANAAMEAAAAATADIACPEGGEHECDDEGVCLGCGRKVR